MGLLRDIAHLKAELKRFDSVFAPKNLKKAARESAKVLKESTSRSTPVWKPKEGTQGYRTRKTAAGGLAVYYPGNLARSIKVISHRKYKQGVYVAPKVDKKGAGGVFKGKQKVDGYYMGMGTLKRNPIIDGYNTGRLGAFKKMEGEINKLYRSFKPKK